jgi:chitinase
VDSGINAWLKAGFPADKIVLGILFYGYKFDLVKNANDGLYQTFSGVSSLSYDSIAENYIKKRVIPDIGMKNRWYLGCLWFRI